MVLRMATVGLSMLLASAVCAQTLADLVPQEDDSLRCWQRSYTADHLAKHPDQLVTAMMFGARYEPQEDPELTEPGLTLFGLGVAMRGSKTGYTSGVCYDNGGEIRCGVECDGGGVVLEVRDSGDLLVDLEATGYIRMDSECGGGDGETSFPLEPGIDDREFLLHAVDPKMCINHVPNW